MLPGFPSPPARCCPHSVCSHRRGPAPTPTLLLPLLSHLSSASTPSLCQAPCSTPKYIPFLSSPSPLPSRLAEPGQDAVQLGPVVPMQNACGKVRAEIGLCGVEEVPWVRGEVKQQLCKVGSPPCYGKGGFWPQRRKGWVSHNLPGKPIPVITTPK